MACMAEMRHCLAAIFLDQKDIQYNLTAMDSESTLLKFLIQTFIRLFGSRVWVFVSMRNMLSSD